MGDKIRHLSSTSGYQNLFSAGLSMSPIVWDSALAEGSSPSRQPAFNFDDQTTSRWRQQQQPQQQVIKSKCSRKHSRSGKAPRARKQNKTITEKAEQLVNLEQSNEQEDYETSFPQDGQKKFRSVERQFKEYVIRKLLAEFSLDKTISKYRSLSATSYNINPSDYSYDCALNAQRLKDRLRKLTSSEVISINDREYTAHVCQLLDERTQDEMARADRRRAQQECLRLRRLMQQGVISADELQAELAVLGVSRNGAKATSSSGTRASTGRPRKKDAHLPHVSDASSSCTTEHVHPTSSSVHSLLPGHQATGIHPPRGTDGDFHRPVSATTITDRSEHHTAVSLLSVERHDTNDKAMPQNDAQQSQRGATVQPSINAKYQPPLLSKLREEQRLDEMYRLADRLLYGKRK